jgi:hypothetical protein
MNRQAMIGVPTLHRARTSIKIFGNGLPGIQSNFGHCTSIFAGTEKAIHQTNVPEYCVLEITSAR